MRYLVTETTTFQVTPPEPVRQSYYINTASVPSWIWGVIVVALFLLITVVALLTFVPRYVSHWLQQGRGTTVISLDDHRVTHNNSQSLTHRHPSVTRPTPVPITINNQSGGVINITDGKTNSAQPTPITSAPIEVSGSLAIHQQTAPTGDICTAPKESLTPKEREWRFWNCPEK